MSLFLSISPITPIVSFSEHMSIAKIHSLSAWSLWCFGNVSLLCGREATSFLAFVSMFTGRWSITIGASFLFLLVMGVLECREATAAYQSEASGLQKHIQLLQSRLESLGGQTSSLIQWRRARAAAASSTANNLLVVEEKLAARNLEVIPHTVQFHPPLFHYWIHYCTLDARTYSTHMFQNLKIGRFHQLIYHVCTLSCTASIIHSWADCCFRNVLVKSTILYIWQICLKDFFLDLVKVLVLLSDQAWLNEGWVVPGIRWIQCWRSYRHQLENSHIIIVEKVHFSFSLFAVVPLPLCDVDWLDSEVLSSWPFSTHFWSECLWQAWTSTLLPHDVWILQCRRWDFYLFCRFATLH